MKKTFESLQLTVDVHQNTKKGDFETLLQSYTKEDYTELDIFMCFILSHGKEGLVYTADGETFDLVKIRDMFINSKNLQGKIKIFFIQTCQGGNISQAVESDSGNESDPVQINKDWTTVFSDGKNSIPVESDFWMEVATTPGKMLIIFN